MSFEFPYNVVVDAKHIALLKKHRFFAKYFRGLAEPYLTGDETGWLQPGKKWTFRSSVEIEPYTGIYRTPYRPSRGHPKQNHPFCTIGSFSYSHSALPEQMSVGRYCSISTGLRVLDFDHPISFASTSVVASRLNMLTLVASNELGDGSLPSTIFQGARYDYPQIGNDVWIGQDVTLRTGITIGNGAVVAANSVVTKDVPDYAVVAGNPASVKKYRFPRNLIDRLQSLAWWRYSFVDIQRAAQWVDVDLFASALEDAHLPKYEPIPLRLPDDFIEL
jgi:acetyltransferase-like isoleucine patch superfamily enzyme